MGVRRWRYSDRKLYLKWTNMRYRCSDPNHDRYSAYGGRGITVCKKWDKSFDAFYKWAIAIGYREGLSLERKNNDRSYSPSNCHFIEIRRQSFNRQNTVWIEAFGQRKSMAEWAEDERCAVQYHTLVRRIKRGWSVEDAISRSEVSASNRWRRFGTNKPAGRHK